MKVPPPVVLWSGSCGEGLSVLKRFSDSSWFWEVIDLVYSQMGTIQGGVGGGGG